MPIYIRNIVNVIKKAEKDGVRVSCGVENRGVCEALIQSTLERQHIGLLSQGMLEGLSRVKHIDYWVASLRENFRGLQFCYGVKIVLPIICLAALPLSRMPVP